MVSKKTLRNLELLGVDVNSSKMQVFRAVLIAAGGPSKHVRYDEIASSLESVSGKKFTKAYIYRRLKDLEEEGFVVVDTISKPRTYAIVEFGNEDDDSYREPSVAKALNDRRLQNLSEKLTRRQEVTSKINRLKSVKSQELALVLHRQLAGILTGESGVIEGVENVRGTIIREFTDGAKEGDTVRVLGHASTLEEGLGPGGVTELRLMQSGFRGVKVLGLLTSAGQETLNLDLMAGHLTSMSEVFEQVAKTGNIQLKFTREPVNTYRMVSLNEDKMLLYLTHAKESNMAALVHREDNPELIDDALKTFDELWESGIDVLELVKGMLREKRS